LSQQIAAAEKKLGKTGRVLFRYSGTEKLARIMVEGQDADVIEALATELTDATAKAIAAYKGPSA